jgi:uncharacterized membrane protein YhhN
MLVFFSEQSEDRTKTSYLVPCQSRYIVSTVLYRAIGDMLSQNAELRKEFDMGYTCFLVSCILLNQPTPASREYNSLSLFHWRAQATLTN